MKAFTANKDVLSCLAGEQRKILCDLGRRLGNASVLPRYPLWAFYDDGIDISSGSCTACSVGCATFCKEEKVLFFPVRIESGGAEHNMRIVFADIRTDAQPDLAETGARASPIAVSSFRIGTVLLEDNAWALTGEQWVKIS